MSPMLTALPQAGADNGLPIAVAVALAVTALVAIGMAVAAKLRHTRFSPTAVGIGAGAGLAILVGALLVGGALTRPSTAVADENTAGKSSGSAAVKIDWDTFQLPTL